MIAAEHWRADAATGLPLYAIPDDRLTERYDPRMRELIRRHNPDRSARLALVAAAEAIDAAGWRDRAFSILVGSSRGPTGSWEHAHTAYAAGEALAPSTSPRTTLGSTGFTLAEYFGNVPLSDGLSVTCSSGFHALLHGVALLRASMVERVLVGGAEAPLTPFTLRQMAALGVYAQPPERADQPACHPFATPATGMALGEGAGFLALELATDDDRPQIIGLGFARETGRGRTGVSRTGLAFQAAMRGALSTSDLRPTHLIPHAPGTRKGDAAERAALLALFPDPHTLPTKTYKSTTGHTFGASGPIALIQALRDPTLPTPFLVNATGFGGNVITALIHTPDCGLRSSPLA